MKDVQLTDVGYLQALLHGCQTTWRDAMRILAQPEPDGVRLTAVSRIPNERWEAPCMCVLLEGHAKEGTVKARLEIELRDSRYLRHIEIEVRGLSFQWSAVDLDNDQRADIPQLMVNVCALLLEQIFADELAALPPLDDR